MISSICALGKWLVDTTRKRRTGVDRRLCASVIRVAVIGDRSGLRDVVQTRDVRSQRVIDAVVAVAT
jgi:hypothetical protein